ncbi:MAG: ABC transporter permease, partial [Burkholderiales bacterium PBB5]
PHPFSTTSGLARDYLAALQRAGGTAKPNYSSMEGYVAARVFVEGLKRAGRNPGREDLVKGLESLERLDLGGFQIGFSPRSHVASQFVELTMLTADGRVRR